jgi:hypothetical protein
VCREQASVRAENLQPPGILKRSLTAISDVLNKGEITACGLVQIQLYRMNAFVGMA